MSVTFQALPPGRDGTGKQKPSSAIPITKGKRRSPTHPTGRLPHGSLQLTEYAKLDPLFKTVVPKKEAIERARAATKPKDWSRLSVNVLGFDSLSQMATRRSLPKIVKYLEEGRQAVVLNGYNIVGDGTPQAFIPILMGKTEEELPLTRKCYRKGKNLDTVYPFVRSNFSVPGYVTLCGKDCAEVGMFIYRLKGFDKQPTDHDPRAFYLVSEEHEKNDKGIGPEPQPKACPISAVVSLFGGIHVRHPPDVQKFLLIHHGLYSHNDINLISLADADIEAHLRHKHKSGMLHNALVIVMADHGHRFANPRDAQQCRHCPALVHMPRLATLPERKLCAPLRLERLIASKRLIPHDDLLKYNGAKDNDGFVPKLEGSVQATFAPYQAKFTTTPGDAKHEATVQVDARSGTVTVDLTAVSRINAYGDRPHCKDSTRTS